jgi:phosphopentomutase
MAKQKSSANEEQQTQHSGTKPLEEAQAKQAGTEFEWHLGRITRMGHFEIAGGRQVTVIWEEGGVSSQQGDITDEQWEIFKLAFLSTGRIAVLSDHPGKEWMHDYRFLEAVR